jgi:hypothetical protein
MILAPSREICTTVTLSPARYTLDLDEPTCTVCGYRAVGQVEFETNGDHERREPFCVNHAVDVQTSALVAEPFCPPVVTFFNLDLYRPWGAA